jgi:hypothetical protein
MVRAISSLALGDVMLIELTQGRRFQQFVQRDHSEE